jgi:hypothetical protein
MTSAFESTNVEHMYFAGTLMQSRDYKKSTSGFIHGFRYGARALHRILEQRYHGQAWPSALLPADPAALMEAVIARVNRTSALWQLFSFMADVIIVRGDGTALYCEELPLDYAHDSDLATGQSYFTITLEYGPDHDKHDPFDVSVGRIMQSDAAHSEKGRYLHPVVRRCRGKAVAAEHHVAENLENEWSGQTTHRDPLRLFFARELSRTEAAVPLAV